ncbi:MAG: hypothetical protein LC808_00595 [Actinobacteria bacterium]|nr:hypothetical protein [Actinomycetota bacterium]
MPVTRHQPAYGDTLGVRGRRGLWGGSRGLIRPADYPAPAHTERSTALAAGAISDTAVAVDVYGLNMITPP